MPTANHTVEKLLLNSWSAEYALRVPPADQTVYETWTFPQAYYAGLFSAKAVLRLSPYFLAHRVLTEDLVIRQVDSLAYVESIYGGRHPNNQYERLLQYRITAGKPALAIPDGMTVEDYHAALIVQVDYLQTCHERYIIRHIGADAFADIIAGFPAYLQTGFVADRFATLTHVPA